MKIIKYSITIRNKARKSAKWYGRIRQDGHEKFIPMESRQEAERWLNEQRYLYGEYMAGNLKDYEILMIDSTPVKARKRASEAVLSLRECMDAWERKRSLEGLRRASLDTYGRALHLMLDGSLPLTGFTPAYLKAVISARSNLKAATRRFYVNALRNFSEFLEKEYGVHGLEGALPDIKVDESAKVYWSEYDMEEIVMAIDCRDPEVTLHYREFFQLQAEVGSRQGETGLLTWADVFDDQKGGGVVRFRGETTKSRLQRCVPISFELWASLEARRGAPDELVFSKISPCQATRYSVLKRALDRLGLTGCQHSFRHSRAMLMYAKTKDIKACAQLLGHSPFTAMRYYLAARSLEELRELVDG